MDLSLKPCKISRTGKTRTQNLEVDRLSNLPYELLSKILSLVPTKDGVAASVLCRSMTTAFTWVTSFDFDDSSSSSSRFPTFVNNVLRTSKSDHVTSFRLRFGGDHNPSCKCEQGCFPDIETSLLNTWMCFPLTRNVRVLDLYIFVAKPSKHHLPPAIFTCETLQVLKLDVNIDFDEVSTMPSFRLPNLQVLHLSSLVIPGVGFLTRLVPSCPLLEDLTLHDCWWTDEYYLSISSTSLRRLVFRVRALRGEENPIYFLHISTPNLDYFNYFANFPYENISIAPMNALREAYMDPVYHELVEATEDAFLNVLSLVRVLSNAEHITLNGSCMKVLDCDELKGRLPVFQNLKHLELGCSSNRWDRVLMEFLTCSPCLETLVFPMGFCDAEVGESDDEEMTMNEIEVQFWRTGKAWGLRCWSKLKRIVVQGYHGYKRELDLVGLFLLQARVLEELVICRLVAPHIPLPGRRSLETAFMRLPTASSVSIIIR